jgi:argininosuccinate lyase
MMRQSALRGYATATDLADYLTKKGIPFRDAHEIVAKRYSTRNKKIVISVILS